jgi:hypothetical protein
MICVVFYIRLWPSVEKDNKNAPEPVIENWAFYT